MTFEGWSNYPTWCTRLWITNEEASYQYWRDRARDVLDWANDRGAHDAQVAAAVALADEMSCVFREEAEQLSLRSYYPQANVWTDILRWAVGSINWREIADSILEDLQ